MLRNRPIVAIPNSPWCRGCGLRPVVWNGLVCAVCSAGAQARRRRRQRLSVAGRWFGASLVEALVGVGAGGLSLLGLSTAPGPAGLGGPMAAVMLLLTLAATMFFAQVWLLRPVVRRWLRWATIGGAELIAHWAMVLVMLALVGHGPGLLAGAAALTGVPAAWLQSRALSGQIAGAWRWAVCSAMIWLFAAAAILAWELLAPHPVIAIVGGAAVGRLVYGILAGPALAMLLVPREQQGRGHA